MKRIAIIAGVALLLLQSTVLYGKEITAMQLLYIIKKVFPEATEISVLVDKAAFETEKEKIIRPAAQLQLKVKMFPVENPLDIGTAIQSIGSNSVALILSSNIFLENSNKLYILSKCKEKQISIVSNSREYSQSGALLGLVDDNEKTTIILNLKHSDFLKDRFTQTFIQEVGIQEVIL